MRSPLLQSLAVALSLLSFLPFSASAEPASPATPAAPLKGAGCGGTTRAGAAQVVTVDTGIISGTVSADTLVPLAEILCSICLPDPIDGSILVSQTQTDGSGAFSVAGLPAGSYLVTFVDSKGLNAYTYWNAAGKPAPSTSEAEPVEIQDAAPSTSHKVDAILTQAGYVTGTVTNANQIGIKGIEATVYVQDANGVFEPAPPASVFTDEHGNFEIGGLPASNRFAVRFSDPQQRYLPAEVPFEVVAGKTTTGVNVQLAPYRFLYLPVLAR